MNLLIKFMYNGSNFNGYQIQPNKRTVQQELEDKLSTIFNNQIKIFASGRTDAGVHALNQYANFKVDKVKYSLKELTYRLNKILPNDIHIKSIKKVPEEFNARFNVKTKIYDYYLTRNFKNRVFCDKQIYIFPFDIDLQKINEIKKLFIGEKSFINFTSKKEDQNNFIRTIYSITISILDNETIRIRLKGNGFMMYQVRMIVANIINYGASRITKEEIIDKLESKERKITSLCFPSDGLYLYDVKY